ncbi:MAG: GAF domain-containing protein [Rhodospirillales bacterium]
MPDDQPASVAADPGRPPRRPSRRSRRSDMDLLLGAATSITNFETLDQQLEGLVLFAREAVGAERGSLFLHDARSNELFTRVADGLGLREIRIRAGAGIAGHVFQARRALIVNDVTADDRFDRSADTATGFVTRNILCVPVVSFQNEIIGVAQLLNKTGGDFTVADRTLLEGMTRQASIVLQSTSLVEDAKRQRKEDSELLDIVSDVSTEINLGPLLTKIIETVTKMLGAERSTLFLNDPKAGQLYTEIGQGLGATRIRFPNHVGIAGAVFNSKTTINIPHAYADLRFNPAFDKQTGFFTRSILCVPVMNKSGTVIGVTQVLNKIGGVFTAEDEARLRAFTAQIAIALENAKLFDDVQTMKNYNEAMLESMSNGVITVGDGRRIVTANASARRIMRVVGDELLGRTVDDVFAEPNAWVLQSIERVEGADTSDTRVDAELDIKGEKVSVNLTTLPLRNQTDKSIGSMLMIEDISSEKRVKATMSRYMDPALADQLLGSSDDILGGKSIEATVMFSDIRAFTTLTEDLGPQGTVALLNEYFSLMVDCIQHEGGMLDKFIGDAIMAVFGTPFPHDDDPDRAVRASIAMLRGLGRFNAERVSRKLMAIDMGIGLATDTIVSGNIGSPKRMDFTVIGDGVNLASRLEGACKPYKAKLLISENTQKGLRGTYRMREIDLVIVKGKTEPVAVFEVLDWHTPESFPRMGDVLSVFRGGLDAYRAGTFDAALRRFEEALALHPKDGVSRLYVERCRHLIANPPVEGWDGVFEMTEK